MLVPNVSSHRKLLGEMLALCELTVCQERRFGSNHLVFLKARPQHAMGRWELWILGYTRYIHTIANLFRNGGSIILQDKISLCLKEKEGRLAHT